jgi:hypothetical protein
VSERSTGLSRFWWRWLVATVLVLGVVIGVLEMNGSTWHFWPLLLLVGFTTSVFALVNVGTVSDPPDWSVESVQAVSASGQDSRLGMYTRAISGHLDARVPDHTLRNRLAALADRRLHQHHAIRLRDPEATDLLGAEVAAILTGPPRRLSRDEIDACVRRIEEL